MVPFHRSAARKTMEKGDIGAAAANLVGCGDHLHLSGGFMTTDECTARLDQIVLKNTVRSCVHRVRATMATNAPMGPLQHVVECVE
jgi:hypothetical protein